MVLISERPAEADGPCPDTGKATVRHGSRTLGVVAQIGGSHDEGVTRSSVE
jgi:hypothetical protein